MKKIILILAAMAILVGGWLFWRFLPSDESPDTLKLYAMWTSVRCRWPLNRADASRNFLPRKATA